MRVGGEKKKLRDVNKLQTSEESELSLKKKLKELQGPEEGSRNAITTNASWTFPERNNAIRGGKRRPLHFHVELSLIETTLT